MDKLVSVIVPAYNSNKYIKKCLDSIINQTYKKIEIIIIDDGSIDGTGDICDYYCKLYSYIHVFHIKNSGVSYARNYAIEKSKGDYLIFVDSDDYIEKNMIEKLLSEYTDESIGIVCCNLNYESENGVMIKEYNSQNIEFMLNDYPKMMHDILSIQGYACNKMYKRKLLNNIEDDYFSTDIYVTEDELFNYKIFKVCKNFKIKYINDKLYHYVIRENSASTSKFNVKKLTYLDSKVQEIDILYEKNIENDFLLLDYIVAFKRMRFMSNINKIKFKEEYYTKYINYKKNIKKNNLSTKEKLKYYIVVFFPLLYYFKLIIKKES